MFVKQRIKIYLSVIILLSAALGIPAFTVYAESQTMAVLEDAQETQETQETSVESQTKEKMLAVTSSTTSSTDDLPSSSTVSEQTDNSKKISQ